MSNYKALCIFLDDTDMLQDEPSYTVLVRQLQKHGISGATVLTGIMGFGVSRKIHRKRLFGVPDNKPVLIIAIDEEEKLRSVLPMITESVEEGLVVMLDVEQILAARREEPENEQTE